MSLPRPYYDADGVTIYHADCRPILATLDPARVLVIADPPYGIGVETDNASKQRGARPYAPGCRAIDFAAVAGDSKPFDPSHLIRFQRAVLWGANHYADKLPASSHWIAWDRKTERGADSDVTDMELAWVSGTHFKTVRTFRHMWAGFQRDSEAGDRHLHPTQKPVALAKWIISRYARLGDTIVEPYMGAGFATVAAKELGYRAIGCELVEDYCRVVVRRLSQRVLPLASAV